MANDFISRADAIDVIEEMQVPIMRSEFLEEQYVFTGMSEALRAIKELPSVDIPTKCIAKVHFDEEKLREIVEEVVIRCKDCKYYTPVTAHCEIRGKGLYLIRGMDDFCSRAERRTE